MRGMLGPLNASGTMKQCSKAPMSHYQQLLQHCLVATGMLLTRAPQHPRVSAE